MEHSKVLTFEEVGSLRSLLLSNDPVQFEMAIDIIHSLDHSKQRYPVTMYDMMYEKGFISNIKNIPELHIIVEKYRSYAGYSQPNQENLRKEINSIPIINKIQEARRSLRNQITKDVSTPNTPRGPKY